MFSFVREYLRVLERLKGFDLLEVASLVPVRKSIIGLLSRKASRKYLVKLFGLHGDSAGVVAREGVSVGIACLERMGGWK